MTFEEFVRSRNTDGEFGDFTEAITAQQARLADRLAVLMATLDTRGGAIEASEANASRLTEILSILQSEFNDDDYLRAVTEYLRTYDRLDASLVEYMSQFGRLDVDVIGALRRQNKLILAQYLTNPQSFARTVWLPLGATIAAAISSEQPIVDAINAGKGLLTGADTETGIGPLIRDAADVSEASLRTHDKRTTKAAADQTEIEFYLFQGSDIDSTREWCDARSGHAWHVEEIKEWGRQAAAGNGWDGMVEGTDEETIFVYLGGWYGRQKGCRHILVPIARVDVPSSDLARMRAKGLVD